MSNLERILELQSLQIRQAGSKIHRYFNIFPNSPHIVSGKIQANGLLTIQRVFPVHSELTVLIRPDSARYLDEPEDYESVVSRVVQPQRGGRGPTGKRYTTYPSREPPALVIRFNDEGVKIRQHLTKSDRIPLIFDAYGLPIPGTEYSPNSLVSSFQPEQQTFLIGDPSVIEKKVYIYLRGRPELPPGVEIGTTSRVATPAEGNYETPDDAVIFNVVA